MQPALIPAIIPTMKDRPTLLLADDDPTITNSLVPFFERAGFHVIIAANGADALEKAQKHHPDLIVLDVLMPRLDGREVLRRMRHAGLQTPTILLTQVGDAVERALALEEGADDYLNKPFESHELLARVRAVLRRSQSGQPSLSTAWRLSAYVRASRITCNMSDVVGGATASNWPTIRACCTMKRPRRWRRT